MWSIQPNHSQEKGKTGFDSLTFFPKHRLIMLYLYDLFAVKVLNCLTPQYEENQVLSIKDKRNLDSIIFHDLIFFSA